VQTKGSLLQENQYLSHRESAFQQANDYVQNDGQQDAENDGSDNGKVAGESFALNGDVTGQAAYVRDLASKGQDEPDDKDETTQNQQHLAYALKSVHFPLQSQLVRRASCAPSSYPYVKIASVIVPLYRSHSL
jgi:hypothetical protein